MTTLNIHPSIHPTQRPGCKLCHYQSTARFGRENNNSKENRAKRAQNGNGHKNGKGSLLDDVVIMVQGNISRRWFDAALRGIDFIGDTMRDDPQCEGACEYLWNLLSEAQANHQEEMQPLEQQARQEAARQSPLYPYLHLVARDGPFKGEMVRFSPAKAARLIGGTSAINLTHRYGRYVPAEYVTDQLAERLGYKGCDSTEQFRRDLEALAKVVRNGH